MQWLQFNSSLKFCYSESEDCIPSGPCLCVMWYLQMVSKWSVEKEGSAQDLKLSQEEVIENHSCWFSVKNMKKNGLERARITLEQSKSRLKLQITKLRRWLGPGGSDGCCQEFLWWKDALWDQNDF